MKKSFNKIALALVILAFVAGAVDVFGTWISWVTSTRDPDPNRWALEAATTKAAAAIINFAWLVGLATLIEIADRIHWTLKNRQ